MATKVMYREMYREMYGEMYREMYRERELETEFAGLADGFEETGPPVAANPLAAGGSTWTITRSLAKLSLALGINLGISIGTGFGRYLLNLNDSLSGPPLTQRERNRLAIGPWEKYSRYRLPQ